MLQSLHLGKRVNNEGENKITNRGITACMKGYFGLRAVSLCNINNMLDQNEFNEEGLALLLMAQWNNLDSLRCCKMYVI